MTVSSAAPPTEARAKQPRLAICPMSFRQAGAFVAALHRHHKPPRGMKFAVGVKDDQGELRGVAMVGRPVARAYDDGLCVEVNRTCTDQCENANSCLYGAAARAAKALGYRRIITYTQEGESGISLKAAGWAMIREIPARSSWAESSVKLKAIRDAEGSGGVARFLWERTL
jgi:hypothetical protein